MVSGTSTQNGGTSSLDYDCVYDYLWRILRAGPPASDSWGEKGISYDRDGAMTSDLNRGVTGISYNRAGRPARIAYAGGVETFSYLADGTKLARTVSRDGEPPYVTEYRGNLVYEGGSLKYVLVDGGMVSMEGSAPRYLYFLDDHLGSTRVAATGDGGVLQVNHYYPCGGRFANPVKC